MSVKNLDELLAFYRAKVVDRAVSRKTPPRLSCAKRQENKKAIQIYSKQAPRPRVVTPPVVIDQGRIGIPCIYLGEYHRDCPEGDIHKCKLRSPEHSWMRCRPNSPAVTAEAASCLSCDNYTDQRYEAAEPGKIGIAVGCYGWPKLAEVQIRLIREHNGPIPILVCDDGSPFAEEFADLAESLQVTVQRNSPRLGHYAGDVSVFRRAIIWGKALGLDYVAKVSQRMLVDRPGWILDAAKRLKHYQRSTLASGCIDNGYDLFVRSELALLNVKRWTEAVDELNRTDLKNPAELHINHVIETMMGGKLHWPGLPRKRYQRAESFVWHCTHKRAEFEALAARYGIELEQDFHVDGAQGTAEKHRGTWLAWERG